MATFTTDQQAEYDAYLKFINDNPGIGLPVPKDIDDYFANRETWIGQYSAEATEGETTEHKEGGTPESAGYHWDIRRNGWVGPGDVFIPRGTNEWLSKFEPEKGETEYSDEDVREYYTYRRYASSYGERDDWYAVSLEDYYNNWDVAQEQLTAWKDVATEKEQEEIDAQAEKDYREQFQLSPEEAARRREESYLYTQWIREKNREAAEYDLSPEEAARRREDSYAYTQWARERQQEAAEYELSPEEQAKRREESYLYSQWIREKNREADEYELSPEEAAKRREDSYAYTQWSRERQEEAAQWQITPEEAARRREESYQRSQDYYAWALSPEEVARRREESYQRQQEAWEYQLSPEEQARRREESYAEAREREEYGLSPEEQARRREESYEYSQWSQARSKYAAQEAYQAQPRYEPGFESWFESQGSRSEPLKNWMESMFPRLRQQYEATLPSPRGYETREQARASQSQIESGWQNFLGQKAPKLEEEWHLKSPGQRGERPAAFAPRVRGVSF